MRLLSLALLLAAGSCLAIAPPLRAADKPARTDAYGDPLPEGALARLGTIRFRDAEFLSGVALSSDGKLLAVGSLRGRVRLLDPATGKVMGHMKAGLERFRFLAFSADGRRLPGADYGGPCQIWDTASGDPVANIQARGGLVPPALSADGKVIATGCEALGRKSEVHAWDAATGQRLGAFEAMQNHRVQVALSPDGKLLASYGQHLPRGGPGNRQDERDRNQMLQLWDVQTGKEVRRIKVEPGPAINRAIFSPDAKVLAIATGGSTIGLWDVATGKELRRLVGRRGIGEHLVFSPDGKVFGAAGRDGVIQLWEVATGKRLALCLGPPCRLVAFILTGKTGLACGSTGQALLLWEVPSGKLLTPTTGHTNSVNGLAFLPDGKLLSAGWKGTVCVWDPAAGPELRRIAVHGEEAYRGMEHFEGFALSPDGKHLAAGRDQVAIRLFDLASGRSVLDLESLGIHLLTAFSPDGTMLAGAAGVSDRKGARIWDANTGQERHRLAGQAIEQVTGMAFSPDSKILATAGYYTSRQGGVTEIQLWDTASGKELHKITRPGGRGAVTFSPDGKLLAVGLNHSIGLWNPATGREVGQMEGPEGAKCMAAAFSPDGRTLATGAFNFNNFEATITLWEVASGRARRQLKGHTGIIGRLAFSPDGRMLASGSEDTTVLVWDLAGRLDAGPLPPADKLWTGLASGDAEGVYRTMRRLMASPQQAVILRKKHLHPAAGRDWDAATIRKLIADLESDQFQTREKATQELAEAGPAAREALQKAVAGNPSAELKRRAKELLARLESPLLPPEALRELRAVEVLERVGTAEAKELLHALAEGRPDARLTREAKAALARLGRGQLK